MSGESIEPAIGIDLGTTYSCVAVWRNNRVEVIPNEQGNRVTPSCVSFKGGERLVGDGAKNVAAINPVDTVFDAKRLIGRRFNDQEVQKDMTYWPFNVISGPDDKPLIVVTYKDEEKQFAPEEISAMILAKMKEIAEAFLGVKVTNAVITVPAYFNDSQRQATRVAGTISGLNVLRMVVEPTAAAIAYGLYKKSSSARNVVIFDLGGGTLDVSLLLMAGKEITVKSTSGDSHLGGEDFDRRMVHHFVKEVQRKHGRDVRNKPKAVTKLKTACDRAKRILSFMQHATIQVKCLYNGVDFEGKMSRAKFEELNMDYFKEFIEHVDKCLKDGEIDKKDVHDVVLVGGSTRIPKLQQMLSDFFYGKELCKSIHPDEAVAYGAAVRAAVLTGQVSDEVRDLTLNDVTPLSLGISTYEECVMDVVVPRNTPFPTKMMKEFYTAEDDQTFAVFKVFQGERPTTDENVLLGEFTLSGIPPAPRGAETFDVCYEIDADGILNVSAEHKLSSNKSSIKIDNVRGVVSGDKVDRMLKEAEMFKADDERLRNKFEAKNSLERFIYDTRASVFNNSCRMRAAVSGRIRREVEEAIRSGGWMSTDRADEADAFVKKREELCYQELQ